MRESSRDDRVITTFARLADTLVDEYDVVDLLQLLVDSCRDLFDVSQAGILLTGPTGDLDVVASTSESASLIQVIQGSAESGPCGDSLATGQMIGVPDLSGVPPKWDDFSRGAMKLGFNSAWAIPMRLREVVIGALNLFSDATQALTSGDLIAIRAFADVATIGILHERSVRETAVLADQLQNALNSRVVVEQAKGVIAHTRGVSIDEAFQLLREYARGHRVGLSDVAARVVSRTLRL